MQIFPVIPHYNEGDKITWSRCVFYIQGWLYCGKYIFRTFFSHVSNEVHFHKEIVFEEDEADDGEEVDENDG